ncbi:MAG TPA: DMT family transporter, partial [Deltaproteobacteria bacterium]|nr:DMT family transporter [Deltaproteobacteria bacterium]
MAMTPHAGQTLRSDALLLITALIWGTAFVAQRVGMDHVGPFGFNGIRFALGCLVLLPLILVNRDRPVRNPVNTGGLFSLSRLGGGFLAGLVLFLGASFQQVAMVYTTAGNAGFITGLYVILVPIIGIFLGHRTHAGTWTGAVLAAVLYWLCLAVPSWPIHPFGLMLVDSYYGHLAWGSIFIGWLLQVVIVKYGGARLYRRARPVFLGLIIGEVLASAVWAV